MTLQAGSVALVPFPFSDLSRSKLRPVLVLTTPDSQGDFVALAINSQNYHPGAVPLDSTGLQSGVCLVSVGFALTMFLR
jgi:mRNA interferase MazF